MSADNWAVCPKCKKDEAEKLKRMSVELNEAYGNVPPSRYDEMSKALANYRNKTENSLTLREDYSQGIDIEGVYSVEYGGTCEKCGFTFSYKYEKKLIP